MGTASRVGCHAAAGGAAYNWVTLRGCYKCLMSTTAFSKHKSLPCMLSKQMQLLVLHCQEFVFFQQPAAACADNTPHCGTGTGIQHCCRSTRAVIYPRQLCYIVGIQAVMCRTLRANCGEPNEGWKGEVNQHEGSKPRN